MAEPKNEAAAELARLRWAAMTPEERSAAATAAVRARWDKRQRAQEESNDGHV